VLRACIQQQMQDDVAVTSSRQPSPRLATYISMLSLIDALENMLRAVNATSPPSTPEAQANPAQDQEAERQS
jgi:hypothetical protein